MKKEDNLPLLDLSALPQVKTALTLSPQLHNFGRRFALHDDLTRRRRIVIMPFSLNVGGGEREREKQTEQ